LKIPSTTKALNYFFFFVSSVSKIAFIKNIYLDNLSSDLKIYHLIICELSEYLSIFFNIQ
jgi:hypothetical protein